MLFVSTKGVYRGGIFKLNPLVIFFIVYQDLPGEDS